jgi:hypothetical protein
MRPSPAYDGSSEYLGKYTYKDTATGAIRPHNPHLTSLVDPDAQAFLNLYGVEIIGCVEGTVLVRKEFSIELKYSPHKNGLLRSPYRSRMNACNHGPINAPLEYWQAVCQTLLDYAIKHGYREHHHGEEHHS